MLDITVPEAIKNRYSCRSFLDKPVPEEVLKRLLENALRAWRKPRLAGPVECDPLVILSASATASQQKIYFPHPLYNDYTWSRYFHLFEVKGEAGVRLL